MDYFISEPNEYMSFGLGKDDSKSDMDKADAVVAWYDHRAKQGKAVDYYLGSKEQVLLMLMMLNLF